MANWSDKAGVIAYAIVLGFAVVEYRTQLVSCRLLFNQVSIIYFASEMTTKISEVVSPTSEFTQRMKLTAFLLLWCMIAGYVRSYYSVPECMGSGFRDFLYWYVMPLFYLGILALLLVIAYMIHLGYKNYQRGKFHREITDIIHTGANNPEILLTLYTENHTKLKNVGVIPFELLTYKLNLSTQFGQAINQYEAKECSICFDEYRSDSEVAIFPSCNHLFHFDCLQNWLMKSPVCPFCKGEFRIGFAQALIDKSKQDMLVVIDEAQIVAYEKDLIAQQPGVRDQMLQAVDQIRNLENPLVEPVPQLPVRMNVPVRVADPDQGIMQEPLIARQPGRPAEHPV